MVGIILGIRDKIMKKIDNIFYGTFIFVVRRQKLNKYYKKVMTNCDSTNKQD